MNEERVYSIDIGGLFPEAEAAFRVQGTAGEVLERIADEWGLEDGEDPGIDFTPNGVYPSVRAMRAHQVIEDRLGKPRAFDDPDTLMAAVLREGLARELTEEECEAWKEEEEMEEYENARSTLDEEWSDGVWET